MESGINPPNILDCSVCLQNCIYPVKLECGHIFCFLCAKGVLIISKRCALCRREISPTSLANVQPLDIADIRNCINEGYEDGFQWFYEGKDGWWLYDQRTSSEIERAYQQSLQYIEILVAGNIYIIDLIKMLQTRRSEPFRKRKIKRDRSENPKKGIAGIQVTPATHMTNTSRGVTNPHAPSLSRDDTTSFISRIPRPNSLRELSELARDLNTRLSLGVGDGLADDMAQAGSLSNGDTAG